MASTPRPRSPYLFGLLCVLALGALALAWTRANESRDARRSLAEERLQTAARGAAALLEHELERVDAVLGMALELPPLQRYLDDFDSDRRPAVESALLTLAGGLGSGARLELHRGSGEPLFAVADGRVHEAQPGPWLVFATGDTSLLVGAESDARRVLRMRIAGEELVASAELPLDARLADIRDLVGTGLPELQVELAFGTRVYRAQEISLSGSSQESLVHEIELAALGARLATKQPSAVALGRATASGEGSIVLLVALAAGLMAALLLYVLRWRELEDQEEQVSALHSSDLAREERMIEDLQARLKQAQGELSVTRRRVHDAGRARGSFLTATSYETRRTLDAALGLAHLLLETRLEVEQREHVITLRESAESLLAQLDSIHDHARIEAGALVLEQDEFELDGVLEQLFEVVAPRAKEQGVELCLDVEPRVPRRMLGDGMRLRRVLLDLLGRCVRGAGGGVVRLGVSWVAGDARELELAFELADSGESFDARELAFGLGGASAEADQERDGLSVISWIVERMGGELSQEAENGARGYRFRARFQRAAGAQRPRFEVETALSGRRLLVADKSAEVRRGLRVLAEGLGLEVEEAHDASQTQNQLRAAAEAKRTFDLALVDEQLAGLSGVRLIKKVSRNRFLAGTRYVLCGLDDLPQLEDRLAACGAAAALQKPIHPHALRAALLRALGEESELEQELGRELDADVLLVEDHPSHRSVLRRLLEKRGALVDEVESSAEAAQALQFKQYDLVLADARLGTTGGTRATAAMNSLRDAAGSDVPLLALCPFLEEGEADRLRAAGVDQLFRLPLRPQELWERVSRVSSGGAKRVGATGEGFPNPGDGQDSPVLDASVLRGLRGLSGEGGPDIAAELVHMFLRDAPERIASLERAFEQDDLDELESASRALRAAASHLGAMALAELCSELESASRDSASQRAGELLERSREEWGRLRTELLRVAEEGGAA